MQTKTLSASALKIIADYLALPFPPPTASVSCPYFNNRRSAVRGALGVLVGKGRPQEIADEAELFARRGRINLAALDASKLKEFLIDNNLGVDCSSLAYHALAAELSARGQSLKKSIRFAGSKNPLRAWIAKFRPAENISVATFADEVNSQQVATNDARPGDLIIFLQAQKQINRNHVLLIHAITASDNQLKAMAYTHSWQSSHDGKYHHGVRQGTIEITAAKKNLLDQRWREQEKSNQENELWRYAKRAQIVSIRRLHCLK